MEGQLTVAAGGGESEAAAGGGGSAADVVAKDNLTFTPKEVSVSSAPVKVSLKNEGSIVHTLQFDEVAAFKKLEVATKGDTAEGTLDVGPGTYTYYCDQPGHRAAGMEGKLKVG
jgi:plastocyanin